MPVLVLTQDSGMILGPIAKVLGVILNYIFEFLDVVGIPNIGLAIILFTIVIYTLMLPTTIKQQKFSKMSALMNPEIQAVQKKYKDKKDQVSMMKMNDETKAIYAKYGTSPTGSCLPLLIQMPILFALYRVIYAIPAYIGKVKEAFYPLVSNVMKNQEVVDFIKESTSAQAFAKKDFTLENTIVDVLNKFSATEWSALSEKFPELSDAITQTQDTLNHYNSFLGLNISETPWSMVTNAFAAGAILAVIGALIIPLLSGLTQWVSVKLMATKETNNKNNDDPANSMASSMKMMNNVMPIMSIYFCFILPAGMGIYWVISAVVRTIQQIVINRSIKNMDVDEVIKKNIEKYNQKRERQGLPTQKVTGATKHVELEVDEAKEAEKREILQQKQRQASEYYNKGNAKPGSLAAKARMVEQFNEKNKK